MSGAASSATPIPSAGTRRRGKALQDAIFDAALDQLRTVGYTGLTMESVASAAGTGKAALYRRWTNKDDLITAALESVLLDPIEVVLTGDPRDDIFALLRCMRDTIDLTRDTPFRVAKKEGGLGSKLHRMFQERIMGLNRAVILDVLRQGVENGLVRPETANIRVADVGPAMLMHHVMTANTDISDAYLASIVDDIVMPLIRL